MLKATNLCFSNGLLHESHHSWSPLDYSLVSSTHCVHEDLWLVKAGVGESHLGENNNWRDNLEQHDFDN
jgi:hypothetical protein